MILNKVTNDLSIHNNRSLLSNERWKASSSPILGEAYRQDLIPIKVKKVLIIDDRLTHKKLRYTLKL